MNWSGRIRGMRGTDRFQVGMRRFHLLRNHQWKPTINIEKVNEPDEQKNEFFQNQTRLTLEIALVPRPPGDP
jgi:hypothetical protein